MKRILAVALTLAFMAAIVWSGAPVRAAGTKVTIWHGWSGSYFDSIAKVFDEYNSTNKDGITVELSNPGDLNKSLEVAIPAGEGPDIISWADDVIGSNVLAGNLAPLDGYGIDQKFLKDNYEPAAVAGVTYDGKIWGLPEAQEGIALVCNSKLVKPTDFPKDAKDFDGLLKLATDFRAKNPDKYLIYNQGLGNSDAYHAAPIWHGFGAYYVKEDGSVGLNTPEGLKAAEWLLKYSAVAPAQADDATSRAALIGGKTACMWTGPWAISDFKKANLDFFIQPFGSPFVGIKVQLLTVNAVKRGTADAAVKVIKYFDSADVQVKLSVANSTIPANSAALKNDAVAKNPVVIGYGKQFAIGVPQPNTPFMNRLWGPAGDATTAIWTKAQKPADALAAAEKIAKDGIKEDMAKMKPKATAAPTAAK